MIKCSKGQVRRLKTALRWKMPAEQRQRIQMVLLRESSDHGGHEALKPRPSGGRKREKMTLEEENALLARFAKAAGAGEI